MNQVSLRRHFQDWPVAKKIVLTAVICAFFTSAQHRPNSPLSYISAAWGQLGVNLSQQGPTWAQLGPTYLQLRPNLGPTWRNVTCPRVGPACEQFRLKLSFTWVQEGGIPGQIWNRQEARFSLVFSASMKLHVEQCSFCCVYVGPTLVQSGHQTAKFRHVRLTWTYVCIALLHPAWAQAGPNPSQFGRARFYCYFKRFCSPCSPPVLGRTSAGPNFGQTCPSCTILGIVGPKFGPSWSQVARVRRKLSPSWAQVGSCSAQLKAKDGPCSSPLIPNYHIPQLQKVVLDLPHRCGNPMVSPGK
jgi:hypothetical protein